ncbi:hypothetical protein GCM10022630_04500 [Thermobifida alba]
MPTGAREHKAPAAAARHPRHLLLSSTRLGLCPDPHRIRTITIEGLTSIRSAKVDLGDLNILVGANGAGKSNFVSALALLGRIVDGELNLFVGQAGGAGVLLHNGAKGDAAIRIRLDFAPNGYEAVLVPAANDELIFRSETVWFHGEGYDRPWTDSLGAGHRKTRLNEEATRSGGTVAGYARRRRPRHRPVQASGTALPRTPEDFRRS